MSKVTQKINDALKEWEEQGLPQWKLDQLTHDLLVRFKQNQWDLIVVKENLTQLNKPAFDKLFDERFPTHREEVDKYKRAYENGLAFSPLKGLAFESQEQVLAYMDILGQHLPQIHAKVNEILGVPAFPSSGAAESGETREDLGLQP